MGFILRVRFMKPIYAFLFFVLSSNFILSQSSRISSEILTTLLNADGITVEDELITYKNSYNNILTESIKEVDDEESVYDKHKALFKLLHSDFLKKYKFEAYINKLFKNKEFNCVTAVILYQMICLDLGLNINLYKTPYHVFIAAENPGKHNITIELTDPVDGFDAELDNSEYIEYLIDYKFITENELKEKGEDTIYKEFVSETYQININELVAIYYTNLASFNVNTDSTFRAYSFIKKAVLLSQDSIKINTHNLIWYLHTENIKSDVDGYSKFLIENLDSIPVSTEFYNQMVYSTAIAVNLNTDNNNFDVAENIFKKLCSVLPKVMLKESSISRIEINIKVNQVNNKIIRGDNEEAFIIASDLYSKYKENDKILDLYLYCGNIYMQKLGLNRNTSKLLEVADSMFTNAPNVKSVVDSYVMACVQNAINSGLYLTDPQKSKEILFNAHKKLPYNDGINSSIGYLYHETAMAEIRNRNYKKALDILNEGLKYDPNSHDLKREIILTKELLNKR